MLFLAVMQGHPTVQEIFAEGLRHHQSGQLEAAERLYREALAVDPDDPDSLHFLGVLTHQMRRDEAAADLISRAVAINPNLASWHSNLGNVHQDHERLDEAIACYRRAIEVRSDFPDAHSNLGTALKRLGRLDEATACYRQAIALNPHYADAHNNLGMALLAQGDMAEGWREHEWRWQTAQMRAGFREFSQPQWRGEAAPGRTLLIHAEQGFGDTLQFCRYAPLAAARGLRVVMQVPRPLQRLLGSLAGVDQVIADGEEPPPFDLHCPMLSLPVALGTTLATVPDGAAYLQADARQVAVWRARLAMMVNQGPKIGLVWAGSAHRHLPDQLTVDRRRSIDPARLAPLFALSKLHFISLQKDGPPPPPDFRITDCMGEMADFSDTAALIANLDLVISVDTAVAHLAAALGKPVWLLDRFDACWRWLVGRRDSPWYPTLRLYRQKRPYDWDSVVAEVAEDLGRQYRVAGADATPAPARASLWRRFRRGA